MLVYNLFTEAVLTAAVIYRPLRAQTDTWHEVGRMVKEATEMNFEDPDLEFSCSDWVRQSIEPKRPVLRPIFDQTPFSTTPKCYCSVNPFDSITVSVRTQFNL